MTEVVLTKDVQDGLKAFTIRPYRSKRLESYYEKYSKDFDKAICDSEVKHRLEAAGYHPNENPRSIYRVNKLFKALTGFAPNVIPDPVESESLRAGISLAYSCFARPKDVKPLHILPMTPATVDLITSNPKGSSGITAYGVKKGEAAAKTRALERGLQTLRGVKQPEPCLGFKRTQFNEKTRLVWGFPYTMTVIEGLVAVPLLRVFKKGTTPMSFAMATGALGTKMRVASYHNRYAYCLDASQFDAHISSKLLKIAFRIWKTWFDLDEVEPVSGVTVREIFNLLERYTIHTPIVMPDRKIYLGKDHGQPSGSFFTQLNDSAVMMIVTGAISQRFNLNVSKREAFVLGDDLMFWANRRIDLDVISKFVEDTLGIVIHGEEKSATFRYDEAVEYLGRIWSNGLPTLDVQGVLDRMSYPERHRKRTDKTLNPVKHEKEVRMMILSYASTYYVSWSIAYDLLDGSDRNIHRGCANLDVNTYYLDDAEEDRVDPDHLSGLVRYQMKYVNLDTKGDIPITAVQYWL